jgi:hypothetical protein
VLWAAQLAMGAAIAVCLFRLICWLGVPVSWSCVLTSILRPFCLLPRFRQCAADRFPHHPAVHA